MNAKDRKSVSEWSDKLDKIKSEIEAMKEEQEIRFDNMPEGLQDSERADEMLEAVDNLDSAVSSIEEAVEYLENC